jgi:hypothetical protein
MKRWLATRSNVGGVAVATAGLRGRGAWARPGAEEELGGQRAWEGRSPAWGGADREGGLPVRGHVASRDPLG